jgi:MFS family permease
LLLGPTNEAVGREMAIIISLVLYTIGAALEAGAISFGMMVAGRVILGLDVSLEGGTVPVYVAESVERKYRGNLVSISLTLPSAKSLATWLRPFLSLFGVAVGAICWAQASSSQQSSSLVCSLSLRARDS